jgi:hypothetical protein
MNRASHLSLVLMLTIGATSPALAQVGTIYGAAKNSEAAMTGNVSTSPVLGPVGAVNSAPQNSQAATATTTTTTTATAIASPQVTGTTAAGTAPQAPNSRSTRQGISNFGRKLGLLSRIVFSAAGTRF